MNHTKTVPWNTIQWPLLGSVSLFFFLRGIHLIITGSGWIATTEQPLHWILLFLEISIAAVTVCICFFFWYHGSVGVNKSMRRSVLSIKTILMGTITVVVIHGIRVSFWLHHAIL